MDGKMRQVMRETIAKKQQANGNGSTSPGNSNWKQLSPSSSKESTEKSPMSKDKSGTGSTSLSKQLSKDEKSPSPRDRDVSSKKTKKLSASSSSASASSENSAMTKSNSGNQTNNISLFLAEKEKRVLLDVGGSVFTTTIETLIRLPKCEQLFGNQFQVQLLDGNPNSKSSSSIVRSPSSGLLSALPEPDYHFFVDRDGTHFRYILNYLRDDSVEVPSDDTIQRELTKEASFYGLNGLIKAIDTHRIKSRENEISNLIASTNATLTSVSNTQNLNASTSQESQKEQTAFQKSLVRTKEDLHKLVKMLDYSQKLREALQAEIGDLKEILEHRNKEFTISTNKYEEEIVELRVELEKVKKVERKTLGQKAKLKEEIKYMNEEIEIVKSLLEKERNKLNETVTDLNERLQEERNLMEKQRNHLELEIADLKEQVEERDEVMAQQKRLFELEMKELKKSKSAADKRNSSGVANTSTGTVQVNNNNNNV